MQVFHGLDETLTAARDLLSELQERRKAWPANTRVGDILERWSKEKMVAYKVRRKL